MNSSKPKRIASIQVCRGLAAMLVVLSHLHNVEVKYCATHAMEIFQFGILGVDLFFVISGFVIASVSFGKYGNRRDAGNFLYRRFARIFPVFWVYTSVALMGYLYNPAWFNATSSHKVNVFESYFLISSETPMLIRQGWTLSFEVYFYLLIFFLLLFASQRSAIWILAVYVFVAAGIATLLPPQSHPVLHTLFSPLLLEFLGGFAIFHIYRKTRLHPVAGVVMSCAAFLWLGGVISYKARMDGWGGTILVDDWQRTLLFGPFAVLLISGAVELERTGLIRYSRFLEDIGDWSYSIYLSHLMIVELIARIAIRFFPGIHGLILLIDLICVPTVLLIGYLSFTYIERPLMGILETRKPVRQQRWITDRGK